MRLAKIISLILTILLLCSCIVKTKKVAKYDEDCQFATRKIELTLEQVSIFEDMHCQNDDCKLEFAERIANATLLFPVSAVVSGSIAVAGNTMYWLEKQENCKKED
jgi:hypothetical protein